MGSADPECCAAIGKSGLSEHYRTLRQFYETLDQSQFWPRERLRAWQERHLTSLVAHAMRTSPFYRFRLQKLFRQDGLIDWDRWTDLPVLTRADVSDQYASILTRAPIKEHGPFGDVSTSGSTGHPVKVKTTRLLNDMSAACNWRAHTWAGLDWSKTLMSVLGELPGRAPGDNLGPWGPSWIPKARKGKMIYSSYATDNDLRVDLIRQNKAPYMATTPNNMLILADIVRRRGIEVRLEKVFLRGGGLTPFVVQEMKEVFGATPTELYSSKEAGSMAHPCPEGHGYHANDEAVLLEIVDDQGQPVAAGDVGRVVVTPFASTAFPLIRYDQGDTAIAGARCACGRALTAFEKISGRTRHEFLRPDGATIDNLSDKARAVLGAGQWQVAKVGPDRFEVRFVRRDWGIARDEAEFVRIFKETFYPQADVKLIEIDHIPLNKNGKFMEKIIEWSDGDDLIRADLA